MTTVYCPNPQCGQKYRIADSQLGRTTVCKRCGKGFRLAEPAHHTVSQAGAGDTHSDSLRPNEPASEERMPAHLGRFQVRCRLGAGAFGAVYRAHDPVLDREVALKVPCGAVLEQPEATARFLREPKAAAQLRHPHIVPVYDAGSDGDRLYIASAFIEGQTLAQVIAEKQPEFRRSAEIVRSLAEALDYAHRVGVIHRDVKPSNIMIDSQGQPLLMDFGLARLENVEEKLTHDGSLMGTPAYMAPEQADSSVGEVGPASDQYSLGVVLYELLCGQTPFSGPPAVLIYNMLNKPPDRPRTKNPAVPRDLETICLKALGKRPGERYADCGEMADDLRRWLEDEPIRARRLGWAERTARWARRNPVLAGLVAAVAALTIVSSVATVWLFASRERRAQVLASAQEKTKLVQLRRDSAAEQAGIAKENKRIGDEKEQAARRQAEVAKDALAQEKSEAEAISKLEAQQRAEKEKQIKLSEDIKQKETQITGDAATIDQAEKKAEKARLTAIDISAWTKYTECLAAADKAYLDHNPQKALELLEACPPEHRAWEWEFLKRLSNGAQIRETVIHRFALGSRTVRPKVLAVSFGGGQAWACISDASVDEGLSNAFVFRLPDTKPAYAFSAPMASKDTVFLSPSGNTCLRKDGDSWDVCDFEKGGRPIRTDVAYWDWPHPDDLPSVVALPTPFSPDGTRFVSRGPSVHLVHDPATSTPLVPLPPREALIVFTPTGSAVSLVTGTSIMEFFTWWLDSGGTLRRNSRRNVLSDSRHALKPWWKQRDHLWLVFAPHGDQFAVVKATPLPSRGWSSDSIGAIFIDNQFIPRRPGYPPGQSARLLWVASAPFAGFSPDGRRVALLDREGDLRLWDLASHSLLPKLSFLDRWKAYRLNPEWTCGVDTSGENSIGYFSVEEKPKTPEEPDEP
jgi:hypothetical protein